MIPILIAMAPLFGALIGLALGLGAGWLICRVAGLR